MLEPVVGLFGTCGSSKWREDIAIPILEKAGIKYFNPVVKDWNEEARKNEIHHAKTDRIILCVITGETEAVGSLAELGWLALNAYKSGQLLLVVLQDMPMDVSRNNKVRSLIRKYIEANKDEHLQFFETIEGAANFAVCVLMDP